MWQPYIENATALSDTHKKKFFSEKRIHVCTLTQKTITNFSVLFHTQCSI